MHEDVPVRQVCLSRVVLVLKEAVMFAVMLTMRLHPEGAWLGGLVLLAIILSTVASMSMRGLRRLRDHLATRRRVRQLVRERPRVEREVSVQIVRRRLRSV